ncbi:DNA replication licensing factor MCM6 [Nematocida sp. AWRm77]|nr:DNA replication licensing factor MCM6 [Nematocida sp. AWRm77]
MESTVGVDHREEAFIEESFAEFLEGSYRGRRVYIEEIQKAIEEDRRGVPILYGDLLEHSEGLAVLLKRKFGLVEKTLKKILNAVCAKHCPEFAGSRGENTDGFSPSLYGLDVVHSVRDLKTRLLGQLVSFSGIVTRSTQVKPELIVGSFECQECKAVVRGIEQERLFRMPSHCINPICMNRTKFQLVVEESQFCDWQKVRIQEPVGETEDMHTIPRTIEVLLRNDLVEIAKPGDGLVVTGYLMSVPSAKGVLGHSNTAKIGLTKMPEADAERGRTAQGRSINHELIFAAVSLSHSQHTPYTSLIEKERSKENREESSQGERIKVAGMRRIPNLVSALANSLFPSICGHENIKTAILLMLVGGVSKKTPDGISLRGDINILLVGDPGTAKSQFLKQTSGLLERGVYTSGKGSSAAGLTASVIKDETGEFSIEAGALMLSDSGVCCIDEFDKMDERDRVAIHEAMEQQSITLAKGGIHATLSARTSILAAANPVRGRYDLRKTLRQNIRLSGPIMSRFDLFFVLVDTISIEHDQVISNYILKTHMNHGAEVRVESTPFSVEDVKMFIRHAKGAVPFLSDEAREEITKKYLEIRKKSTSQSFTPTPRQLESIIRISEAIAKVYGLESVSAECVEQAYILLSGSIMNILTDDIRITIKDVIGEKEVVIKYDEYIQITSAVVHIIQVQSSPEDGISKEELVQKYIEQNELSISTEKEYFEVRDKLSALIDQLIHKECMLYEQDDNQRIHLHPNYNTY